MQTKSTNKFKEFVWGRNQKSGQEEKDFDWRRLGSFVKNVPQEKWEENMLFKGARDVILKRITGCFPRTMVANKSHPIFVDRPMGNLGHMVCPCSSSSFKPNRYIHQGCCFLVTNKLMKRQTYILDQLAFNLKPNQAWTKELCFMGLVPKECIRSTYG